MAHEKLMVELNSFIEKNNLKKGQVEKDLGLPLNSLSNFLKLKKPLPDKWVQPILKYCLGDLSDKVTTADKVSEPPPKEENTGTIKELWVADIENYCEKTGITPSDLIETHISRNKAPKSKKTTDTLKTEESAEYGRKLGNVGKSNWFNDYRKSKLGLK